MARKATINIRGYLAVISKIQNVYPPEELVIGYQTGFKYESGIFEYFVFEKLDEAELCYKQIEKAIEDYYNV